MTTSLLRRSGAPVLVGRETELRRLVEAMGRTPSVTFVEGEAGIGKTRLIHEALDQPEVRGRRILTGVCLPLREPFPYGPVFDLLRRVEGRVPQGLNPVCGALRPYLPELAGALPPAPEPLTDHRADRHRLFRAVRTLLGSLGDAVVVVEDLHWADDGTRDLVRFLADDPPAGTAAVLSYRREDLPGGGLPLGRAYRNAPGTTALLLPLRPLDVSAVRTLTAAITGDRQVPVALATELHARTAGIPFVVEEMVRALDGAGTRTADGSAPETLDALEVPALLRDAMADRMTGLSPHAVAVVHAAAVLRIPAGQELLVQAVGGDPSEAERGILEALRAGVLYDCGDDRYGFRHTLAQQAVYSALPGVDRRRLHRGVIAALSAADRPPTVQLAYHAQQSGDADAWLRYGGAAARQAGEMGDTATAVELLEALLSDPRLPTHDRAALATELSRVAVIGLAHRRAVALLRRVIRDGGLPDAVRGEIRLNLGLLLSNQAGAHDEGRAVTTTAVGELQARPALAARAMSVLAMPNWGEDPYAVHHDWIQRAERLVADEQDLALRLAVRGNHLALRMSRGEPSARTEAETVLATGRSTPERLQIARLCGNLAEAATWLGHFEEAEQFRVRGQRLAEECGAPFLQGVIDGTALRLQCHTGHWTGLADRAREVLDMVEDVSGIAADAHLVLGLLAVARGEWEEAATELGAAALDDPANAPAPILAAASGALVRVHTARGETDAACAESERALDRLRRKDIWVWGAALVPAAVAAYVRDGQDARAAAVLAEFTDGIAQADAPQAAAAQRAARGTVEAAAGRHEEAALSFEGARSRYAALPHPYAAARAHEARLRSLIAAGDTDAAAELAPLAEQFTALGATRDAARCRRVLRGNGVMTPSRRGRRGYGSQLSPRETEVARLVALGRTNREIAAVLFLSPRTVEQHVAKVLRKLGASSREQIAGREDLSGPPQDA
ncbi:AAA family ATPase [Streptomyces sp. NA04227]|uniref:ATP-binding protein n=1 Tax=Streptomyces sp. NA04227 TaxID=2742136 RepID=UPI0015926327|nr:LuxR family transcriptional regulator [Streptomyces sp. NA04227]QKW10044.1 AAA family ATPase [Streptomyces sp. NA04227]